MFNCPTIGLILTSLVIFLIGNPLPVSGVEVVQVATDAICISINDNPKLTTKFAKQIACYEANCEWNLVQKYCVHARRECENKDFNGWTEIRIPTHLYSRAGVICRQEKGVGGEYHPVFGINLGSSRSCKLSWWPTTFYRETKDCYIEEIKGIRTASNEHKECNENQKKGEWFNILGTYVTTSNDPKFKFDEDPSELGSAKAVENAVGDALKEIKKQMCLHYPITLEGNGVYELQINFYESTYTTIHGRCFKIKINEILVSQAVDIVRIAKLKGSCKRVPISYLLKREVGNRLLVNGFPNHTMLVNNRFNLSFCVGSEVCLAYVAANYGFMAGSIHVNSYQAERVPSPPGAKAECLAINKIQKDECNEEACEKSRACQGKCPQRQIACYKADCEYDLDIQKCVHKRQDCRTEDFSEWNETTTYFDEITHIRVPGRLYSRGGVICRQAHKSHNGGFGYHYGINLGNGRTHSLPDGSTLYQEESRHYRDPEKIRYANTGINQFCAWGAWEEGSRYNNYLRTYVAPHEQQNGCLHYPIPLKEDDIYELALFFFDGRHQYKHQRCFDIKIQNVKISEAVDFARIDRTCRGSVISYILKREAGFKMYINGFKNPVFGKGPYFNLTFCSGHGNKVCTKGGYTNMNFIASAFYVMKYGELTGKSANIVRPPPEPLIKPLGHPCNIHGSHKDRCTQHDCEFDLQLEWCVHSREVCSSADFASFIDSRYKNVFYLRAGVFCKSKETIEAERKQVYAIVLARPAGKQELEYPQAGHDDQDVLFEKKSRGHYVDENNLRKTSSDLRTCLFELMQPDAIWDNLKTYIIGNKNVKQGCLTYKVPLDGDGDYEVIIWAVEPFHRYRFKRCFDLKINSLRVARDVDLQNLASHKCGWVSIGIHFKTQGEDMYINGFSVPVSITGNEFQLKFCQGTCGYEDNSFVASAFYVKKFI